MAALAELPPLVPTLSSLASSANEELAAIEANDADSLQRAIRAGEYLIQAKAMCSRGGWMEWLGANVECATQTAQLYMLVAQHQDEVRHCLSIRSAQTELSSLGLNRRPAGGEHPLTSELTTLRRERAHYLKQEGKSGREIAADLGVSESMVSKYLKPLHVLRAESRTANALFMARKAAARKALKEKEQRAAVKRYGGNAEVIYTAILKGCEAAARLAEEKPEQRAEADAVLADLYRAKDKVLAMIGAM